VLYLDSHESRSGKYRNVVRVHDSPVVEFNADGTVVRHRSDIEYREDTFRVREIVSLFHDLNDPSRFHLEKHYEREAFTAKLFLKIGLGWSVIAAVIAWLGGR